MKREILHIAELLQCGMKRDIEFVASALCRGCRTGEFLACGIVQFQVENARNTGLPAFHVHVGAEHCVSLKSRMTGFRSSF